MKKTFLILTLLISSLAYCQISSDSVVVGIHKKGEGLFEIAGLSQASNTLPDGNKTDITVSNSGLTWLINNGVVNESKLNGSVNVSLDLADSALQSGDNISELNNDVGYITTQMTGSEIESALDTELGNTDWKISIPDDAGASNGDVLTTDGAGNHTWETPISSGLSLPVSETQGIVHKNSDETSILGFDISAAPSGERINLTVSDNIDLDAVAINAATVTSKENLFNKATTLNSPNDTKYPSTEAVAEAIGEINLLGEEDAAATRDAVITDANGLVNVNSAGDVIITIQANATTAFPIGTVLSYYQENTGDIFIDYSDGVTGEEARTFVQGHKIVLWQTATDVWQVISRPATASVTNTEYSSLSVELQNNGTAYFIIP